MVPKVAVLFKAAPDGSVIKKLEESAILKPWMKVQVQENGSYRSADVVEALEWMLPDCASPEDSIVVILDWFSGHMTDVKRSYLTTKVAKIFAAIVLA